MEITHQSPVQPSAADQAAVYQAMHGTLRAFILGLHRLVQFETDPTNATPANVLADGFELGKATERLNGLLSRLHAPEFGGPVYFVDVLTWRRVTVHFRLPGGDGDGLTGSEMLALCLGCRTLDQTLDGLLAAGY